MKKKRTLGILLALFLLTTIFTSNSKNVLAYTIASILYYDCVDSGGHLDYDMKDNTKYSGYLNQGINTWNAYKSGVIREDTILTVADIGFSDVYWTDVTCAAITANEVLPSYGCIYFNTYYMDNYNNGQIWNVVTHEFGHALGLAHNTNYDVMCSYVNGVYQLTANDKASYDAAARLY